MKVRATLASPGRIKIKGQGVSKWVEPVGLDGKPREWVELPDNEAVRAMVEKYRTGGQIEVQGFVKMRSSVIVQCAGDPSCPDSIVDKKLGMCYHHAMKLYRDADRAKSDEALALAEAKIEKLTNEAMKAKEAAEKSASMANEKAEKAAKAKAAKKAVKK